MSEKIGMYTEDEILKHLTEGEGRSFLGRSMYDAIFDKIHALITENQQLKEEVKGIREERDYLFNKTSVENKYLQQERDLYKEVIEEVREEFKKSLYFFEQVITEDNEMGLRKTEYKLVNSDKLLQILDKTTKENK